MAMLRWRNPCLRLWRPHPLPTFRTLARASSASNHGQGQQKCQHPQTSVDDWVEVADPQGSGKKYWWNRATNQTTPLGSARPGTVLAKLQAFKDEVARDIHRKQRTRIIVGDGGYYGFGGGGGDSGGGSGA
ncbi:unnamed protein product [Symbiodinium natans]|uniref:Uncharacterized protein n=1 Tax=Symbiodinium natans TaxID=878477 RepID=A0A812TG86_9DINO|nr:unnamed protein product [Symbiodinium natans]